MNSTNPVQNPSPKQRFQESSDNVSKHRTLVDSKEFERAQDFALMEHAAGIALSFNPSNQVDALAAAYRIRGAFEYAMQMRMLSEKPSPVKAAAPVGNLDHTLS